MKNEAFSVFAILLKPQYCLFLLWRGKTSGRTFKSEKGKVIGQYMGFGLSLIPVSWSLLLESSLYFTKHTHGCYWLTLISLWYWTSLGDGVKTSAHLNTMSHSHSSWQPRGIWPWIRLGDNENRQEWKLFRPASPELQPSDPLWCHACLSLS